jgi:hypothetical protein
VNSINSIGYIIIGCFVLLLLLWVLFIEYANPFNLKKWKKKFDINGVPFMFKYQEIGMEKINGRYMAKATMTVEIGAFLDFPLNEKIKNCIIPEYRVNKDILVGEIKIFGEDLTADWGSRHVSKYWLYDTNSTVQVTKTIYQKTFKECEDIAKEEFESIKNQFLDEYFNYIGALREATENR